MPVALQSLALRSFDLYPRFVREVENLSGMSVDLRDQGTIFLGMQPRASWPSNVSYLSSSAIARLEPLLAPQTSGYLLKELSIDPRALSTALLEAARRSGVEIVPQTDVTSISPTANGISLATSTRTVHSPVVVNCSGAWAGAFKPMALPIRPVKGQMLCLTTDPRLGLQHVIYTNDVYLVPRSDGRILIGATAEEAGFDKTVHPQVMEQFRNAAIKLVPSLLAVRRETSWSGLRPATPDGLPILSSTSIPGYYVASGHFRNGILLAPVTARAMTKLIQGAPGEIDLTPFSATRFLR